MKIVYYVGDILGRRKIVKGGRNIEREFEYIYMQLLKTFVNWTLFIFFSVELYKKTGIKKEGKNIYIYKIWFKFLLLEKYSVPCETRV